MLFSQGRLAMVSLECSAVAVYFFILIKQSLTNSVLINVEWLGLYVVKAEPWITLVCRLWYLKLYA